jgi:hypothetical protein
VTRLGAFEREEKAAHRLAMLVTVATAPPELERFAFLRAEDDGIGRRLVCRQVSRIDALPIPAPCDSWPATYSRDPETLSRSKLPDLYSAKIF